MNKKHICDRDWNKGYSKREHAHMRTKHRKWPLGTPVQFYADGTLLSGVVNQHFHHEHYPHGCVMYVMKVVGKFYKELKGKSVYVPFRQLKKV